MCNRSTILTGLACAAVLLQAAMLTSCKDELDWLIGTPINVTASSEPTTRSGVDIQTSSFDEGATINGYFAITGGDAIGKTPTTLTASAADASGKNRLTPDVQPYYPSSGSVDIYALYPPTKATSETTSFSVEADQTDPDDYKLSDLMWAGVSGQAKTTADVNLTFAHKMAKMVVSVTGLEGVTIKAVRLINVVRTVGLTATTGVLGALDAPTEATDKVIVLASASATDGDEELSGAVLFPPQTIQADFIEVETNMGTSKFSVDKTFESGKQYTANLTVTRQLIGFTSTITDWTSDGGSIAVPPGSSAGLKIADIPDQEYTGVAIEPTLSITYTYNSNEYTLVRDVDYELTFFNNKNMGTATVIINGLATAQEAIREVVKKIRALKSFNITSATGSISYPNENAKKTVEYKYNATVDNPLEKNGGDGKFTYSSSAPTVATVSESGVVTIRGVGTTTISASMDNSGNYTAASAQYELEVIPRSIKDAVAAREITITLSNSDYTYTGQAFTPAVTVTDNGRTLVAGTHYTVAYSNNTNVGSNTAVVTVTGMGNYDGTTAHQATKTFSISQATPSLTMDDSGVTLPVGRTVTRVAKHDLGTVTYSSDKTSVATVADGVVTAVGEGTATIKAEIVGNDNYSSKSISYTVTVVKSYWTYSYTGAVQSWTCPLSGVYQLEALGAQGGSHGGFFGGRGAQVAGQLYVEKDQTLYIYVGQAGVDVTSSDGTQGGWNGGGTFTGTYTGYPGTDSKDQHAFCGGGGATDFALVNAAWKTNDHWNSRILVAGGGGGALFREYTRGKYSFSGAGGSGGAFNGAAGIGGNNPGGGGTLTAGGTTSSSDGSAGNFGYGGDYAGTANSSATSTYLSAGMGGGGWYGGGSGGTDTTKENPTGSPANFSTQGSGGGGSSYIYNAENAQYYPSGVTKPDVKFYILPTILVEGARSGNGEARITYMGEEL